MLNSSEKEYRMMYEAEETLWWYRILHEKVLAEIQKKNYNNLDINILDVGCGTGGLLEFLRKNGYKNIQGIDYSEPAIQFCKERNLNVQRLNIDQLNELDIAGKFDVIVCNDVFYCLEVSQIKLTFYNVFQLLKNDGIFVSNNNAFDAFYGTHDLAVGGKRRFTIQRFRKFLPNDLLYIKYYSYWTWVLSPLVFAIRFTQRIGMKFGFINTENIVSDVEVPSDFVNNICYQLVKTEEKLLEKGFFGSSLFMVMTKKNSFNASKNTSQK
jgi:SAM-dependent methyltransferase